MWEIKHRWILKLIHSLACIYPKMISVMFGIRACSSKTKAWLWFEQNTAVNRQHYVTNTVRTMPCYMFVSHYCFKILYNYVSNSGFRPFQGCYETAFRLETLRSEVKRTHHARHPEIQWRLRHCRGTRGWYGWSELVWVTSCGSPAFFRTGPHRISHCHVACWTHALWRGSEISDVFHECTDCDYAYTLSGTLRY